PGRHPPRPGGARGRIRQVGAVPAQGAGGDGVGRVPQPHSAQGSTTNGVGRRRDDRPPGIADVRPARHASSGGAAVTRVDVYWTEPHFGDHIVPTFEQLPPERRGHVLNLPPGMEPPPGENLLLVASWGDLQRARAAGRRVIFSEHGCGQFFRHPDGRLLLHSSYAGAARPGAVLILVPNEVTASAYEESGLNPGVPVAVVGCPKLDPWIDTPAEPNEERTVAISFHWDCRVVPETGSAWREYFSPPDALAE